MQLEESVEALNTSELEFEVYNRDPGRGERAGCGGHHLALDVSFLSSEVLAMVVGSQCNPAWREGTLRGPGQACMGS